MMPKILTKLIVKYFKVCKCPRGANGQKSCGWWMKKSGDFFAFLFVERNPQA